MQRRGIQGIAGLICLLALVAGGWWVLTHRLALYDWARLHNYQAPATVSQLATDTTLTPDARHIFYVNHPAIESSSVFNQNCKGQSEQTIVLGCYHSDQMGIYLYDVTDARLEGVEQVTAAHEMLHAAYDRLSAKDKNYVDGLLQDYYQHDLHDQRIIDTINAYKQSEPNDVVNEMHSVFGTEIQTLPTPLENYYKRYFTDRSQIAAYAASYESEFTTRKTQIAAYDAQLSDLKAQINSQEADLKAKATAIDAARSRLDAQRSSGNIEAYNAAVPGFNAQVDAYNSEVASTKDLVAQYNDIVAKRNAIVLEEQQLTQALDSQTVPQPAQ
jgi:hypothetical protein